MKLVYAALYDPFDVARGSGTSHYLCRALEARGHTVLGRTPPEVHRPLLTRLLVRYGRARGLGFRAHQDPRVGRLRGTALSEILRQDEPFDALITNDATLAAYTETSRPVVLYTDAMFPRHYRENVHPWLDGLSWISVNYCQRVQRRALQRATWVAVASHWAADLAMDYGVLQQRPAVIPYGANLPSSPQIGDDVLACGPGTSGDIELLFVGKDWQLKGGDVVLDAVTELRRRGHRAVLHLVGAAAPVEDRPSWIVEHGFLDKAQDGDRARLEDLYRRAFALFLPSRAEGFGIVFAEAAAFGVPSLATRTTGVETSVHDGVSGALLPLESPPEVFADVLEGWILDPESHRRLRFGARRHYQNSVCWPAAVTALTRLLEESLLEETS